MNVLFLMEFLEPFIMFLAIGLLFCFFYVMGEYRVFNKHNPVVRLSEICPELDNIEPVLKHEVEWKRIRLLLQTSLGLTEKPSPQSQ